MKREFLEGLGLSRELIDSIIAEHGKSTEAIRSRCEELEAQCLRESELSMALEKERAAFSAFKNGVINELADEACPSSLMARETLVRRLSENCDGALRQTISALRIAEPDAFSRESRHLPVFSSEQSPTPPSSSPIPFSRIR